MRWAPAGPFTQACTPHSQLCLTFRVPACAVKRLVSEDRFPHVLFYGPPGTGKTSTILAVARQMYGDSLRWGRRTIHQGLS